ncbi:hypothetical protein DXH95_02630 [Sphingorhabdus pulchriflava]|uniref:Uncharacterized protein n=1 Tax=Sphingorhabdus pulchriflava TaxID=2292257 RepID=A0A371BFR5_9SPHN|nr:hypothetical protein [Sphingorhabdus pulchriflava]RDV06347.1 hypothetical protein DXH95_02630 [Sphingorhabdus pulchriflava]
MFFGYTPLDFQQFKMVALDATGLAKDALHIYAGMALFLTMRLLWRWRGGWVLAWLAVLAMACTVEWIDMKAEGAANALQPDAAHWHDIWNTMFWPSVLLLVGRWLQPKSKAHTPLSGDLADQPFEEPPPV